MYKKYVAYNKFLGFCRSDTKAYRSDRLPSALEKLKVAHQFVKIHSQQGTVDGAQTECFLMPVLVVPVFMDKKCQYFSNII